MAGSSGLQASGDFNGDGKADLASTGIWDVNYIALALGRGDGSFVAFIDQNPNYQNELLWLFARFAQETSVQMAACDLGDPRARTP